MTLEWPQTLESVSEADFSYVHLSSVVNCDVNSSMLAVARVFINTPRKLTSATKWEFCFSLGELVVKHLLQDADMLRHTQRRMVLVVRGFEALRKGSL